MNLSAAGSVYSPASASPISKLRHPKDKQIGSHAPEHPSSIHQLASISAIHPQSYTQTPYHSQGLSQTQSNQPNSQLHISP